MNCSNDITPEINPGTSCYVYNKKGVVIKEVYYGYCVNGNHYFYNTKTEAITSRSNIDVEGVRKPQNYKRFKIKKD